MMGWDVGFGDGSMVSGGWLMMLLFWGILATLIVLAVSYTHLTLPTSDLV